MGAMINLMIVLFSMVCRSMHVAFASSKCLILKVGCCWPAMANVDGLANELGQSAVVIRNLTTTGRLIVPAGNSEIKSDNKTAGHNRVVMEHVLNKVAAMPNWELPCIPALEKQLLSISDHLCFHETLPLCTNLLTTFLHDGSHVDACE